MASDFLGENGGILVYWHHIERNRFGNSGGDPADCIVADAQVDPGSRDGMLRN